MENQLTEKQVDIKEGKISFWEGGQASSSTPIVFLPGWSVSVAPYQESLKALSERYHVLAPDLPGFGKSSNFNLLQNYQDYADCIIDFLESLTIKKIHIIGHSMGGAIAITIATSMPSLVRSLVVVDSTGIPLGSLPEVMLRRSIELPAQLGSMKFVPLSNMVQSFFYNCLFRTKNVIGAAGISLVGDVRPMLSHIECPTLVLWGENDRFTPMNLAQELAQGIKGSQLILLKGEYHEWSMFRPEKFSLIICDFIDEVEELK